MDLTKEQQGNENLRKIVAAASKFIDEDRAELTAKGEIATAIVLADRQAQMLNQMARYGVVLEKEGE